MPSSEPFGMMMETFSIGMGILSLSDATAGLGDAGDLGRALGGAFGEELVQLFDGDTGGLAEDPDGGASAVGGVLGPHDPDDLPVSVGQPVDSFAAGQLGNHGFRPLVRVDEEA